jgi:hypothetical protein
VIGGLPTYLHHWPIRPTAMSVVATRQEYRMSSTGWWRIYIPRW